AVIAPTALIATDINITQAPILPIYLFVKPLNCKSFLVLKVVSATYNIITVVNAPVTIIQNKSIGHPACLEPNAKLNMPAPIFVLTIREAPSNNVNRVLDKPEVSSDTISLLSNDFSTPKIFHPLIINSTFKLCMNFYFL